MKKIIVWIDVTPEDFMNDPHGDDEDFDEDGEHDHPQLDNLKKIAVGPFGAFEVHDFASPYTDHSVFTGHTNFVLTNKVVKLIDSTEGVDILRVPSKYTFHIGIGLGFSTDEVLNNIEQALGVINDEDDFEEELAEENDDVVNEEMSKIFNKLINDCSGFKYWAFYILPNGTYDFTYSDGEDMNEFNEIVEQFKEYKKLSGGIFYSNDETSDN